MKANITSLGVSSTTEGKLDWLSPSVILQKTKYKKEIDMQKSRVSLQFDLIPRSDGDYKTYSTVELHMSLDEAEQMVLDLKKKIARESALHLETWGATPDEIKKSREL